MKVVHVGRREERVSTESRGGSSEADEATTTGIISSSRDALPFSPGPTWLNSQ